MVDGVDSKETKINVRAGSELSVRLASIPTAGYLWRLDACPDAIEPLGDSMETAPGQRQVGGMVTQIFRFRASEKGEFTLRFILKREWENLPAKIHLVNVTVN
jgi:predicted secreted protein